MRPLDPNCRPRDLALPDEIREGHRLQFVLYRFFDAEQRLLYVGITTGNPRHRWRAHQRDAPWWHEVAFVHVEHLPTWQSARAAERAAIRSEEPVHNVADRPGWYPARAADEGRRAQRIANPSGGATPLMMPVTQARTHFSDLVNRVSYDGWPVRLTRRDRVMVALISPEDYDLLMAYKAEEGRRLANGASEDPS